ncbi:hypothetical protein P280DRAFT_546983 [Massarina eburnea CBS 473.64]|uniref:GH16 domain-containing protein n=1 Tax=Massarina eburnea CBS 473.64 TaxID=1395130 RepID=A0A6A6SBM9_9PLEO|nr:hypothetical protein P280DRAFT_546983 [Massarina eburnea CBS 473.64]
MPNSLSLFLLLVILPFVCLADLTSNEKNCSCGFYDKHTSEFFTDSIVLYFNETQTLPQDLIVEDYERKYEKDWNAIYRQGADPSNVQINKSDSLQLFVSPPAGDNLIKGGGVRTARRDIQHGSFRTSIKSPQRSFRGSAISMMWQYNETETAELSVMNANDQADAWVGTFVNGEFTTSDLGVNFSTILDEPAANRNYTTLNGTLENGTVNPWEYVEYRIDWTKDFINFYIGGNLTRSVSHEDNEGMPSVPSALYFKHWSTGNRFSMEGPPKHLSEANVGWMRMFFNSSSITKEELQDSFSHCSFTDACLTDDTTLRGSTSYSDIATLAWKQGGGKNIKRMPALWISVVCISLSTFLLIHALIRRAPWRKQLKASHDGHSQTSTAASTTPESDPFDDPKYIIPDQSRDTFHNSDYTLHPEHESTTSTPVLTRPSSSHNSKESDDDLAITKAGSSSDTSIWGGSTYGGPSRVNTPRIDGHETTPYVLPPLSSDFDLPKLSKPPYLRQQLEVSKGSKTTAMYTPERPITPALAPGPEDKIPMETVTESALPAPRMRAQPPSPRERIDYLAGLVAVCAVLVTVMHFCLTFVPGVVIVGAPQHHASELWAQKLVAPFILNQMWLGVFFTTSVRFLVAGYLKRGDLKDIAKAAVRRTPRLMIPVASIALLQYFLIDVGATSYLRYIPSLTWSTWPYVTRYPTFGHYVSEVLELIYLIPNAVPQITYNFCTGVLWTIAVQLQGTWLVLCGAIVVYEIKRPWKRMCYYMFCLVTHWYAQSWGSYLWLGLLLTDLDITYKYKKWLYDRPRAYYPLITLCWLCVAAGFSANLIPSWVEFNFTTYEHNIHPDPNTGEPMMNTPNAGYPEYYIPRLNGLLFAGGMQAIVELSPVVQWVLSLPPLLVLFPHIFTIYLMHGLVFWSWGSWLMIFIADRDISYSVNVVAVGVTSYAILFAILPIVTPVIEALGKDITALCWMSATEKPPPKRRTLFPFPDDLFARRGDRDVETAGGGSAEVLESDRSSASEKDVMKGKEKVSETKDTDF